MKSVASFTHDPEVLPRRKRLSACEQATPGEGPRYRLKILAVIPSLTRGGAERVLSLLTRDWAKCHNVVVAAFDASQPAYEYHGRVVSLGLRLPPKHALASVYAASVSTLRLITLFRAEAPDRIISFMEPANFPAILASVVSGTLDRAVVSVRQNPSILSATRRLLIPRLYRLPSAVVACSDGVRSALVAMGVPAEHVTTIPNPIVLPSGSPCTTPKTRPASERFVLAAGRLTPAKGFDMLLSAFSVVRSGIRDLNLVVLGDGPERDHLLSLARRLGIDDRVCFPGSVRNISRWYQSAECFVLSSRNEGWPNVLVEAMAAGCPVVSFRCDYGPEEIVQHGTSGLLVAAGDVDALARSITRVVTNRVLSATLSAGAQRRAQWFASQAVSPRWLTQ